MSSQAVQSRNSVRGGERRILRATPATAAVPAASSTTDATVAPDALLENWENHGDVAVGIRADGRLTVPTHPTDPAVLHNNDLWVGLDGGAPVLRYRRGGATVPLGGSGGTPSSPGLSLRCLTDGLAKGVVVRTLDAGGMVCDVAQCGLDSVSTEAFRAVGLLNAAVNGVTPVEILISGMRIDLTGSQIDHLTGTGVLIPSKRYFLSSSGRWTLDPIGEPNAEVVMPIGTAVTTTSFLIQIGPAVIL